jgi:DNA-binding CsgD family transcriptional regulator
MLAETVYRHMLANPGSTRTEIAALLGHSEEAIGSALDRLSGLALIHPQEGGAVRPVRPEVGIERLLALQQTQLAAWQQQIEASRVAAARLISECSEPDHDPDETGSERLTGLDAIRARISELTGELTEEIMTFAPGGAHRPEDLEQARHVDEPMLERGVRIRTLWLDSIRNDGPTLRYARWLCSRGGQTRTVPTLPIRMIILDRASAILPTNTADATVGAVLLRGQGTIAALCALFETFWETGTPVGTQPLSDEQGLTPLHRTFLRLLGEGLTDQAIARRLGVSHRTARRIAADLMDKLGARSRFEAGLKAAARGWLHYDQ